MKREVGAIIVVLVTVILVAALLSTTARSLHAALNGE